MEFMQKNIVYRSYEIWIHNALNLNSFLTQKLNLENKEICYHKWDQKMRTMEKFLYVLKNPKSLSYNKISKNSLYFSLFVFT